jgi:cytoskeletal protein CcmA (bactofilin family)
MPAISSERSPRMLQKNPSPASGPGRQPAAEAAPKLLVVGPDITLAGEITACDRLVVEGNVRVALDRTRAIEITPSGRFTEGRAEVEEADIGGVYEGELTVRGRLLIRATGRVAGRVRYGELEIERGGRLEGSLGDYQPADPPPTVADSEGPSASAAGPD